VNYRLVLSQAEPDRVLYLAVSEYVYTSFFGTEFGALATESHRLRLTVFDEELEVITRWVE
jgi:hypothetical protein